MKKMFLLLLVAAICGCMVVQAQEVAPEAVLEAGPPPARPHRPKRRQLRQEARPGQQRTGAPQRQRQENQASAEPIARIRQAAAELLQMYDKDKDGKLSEEEREAMEKDLAEAETKARLAREYWRVKAVDVDGDLVISPEEEKQSTQRLREAVRQRMEGMQKNRENLRRRERPAANAVAPPATDAAPAPAE